MIEGGSIFYAENSLTLTNTTGTISLSGAGGWAQINVTSQSGIIEFSLDNSSWILIPEASSASLGPFDPGVFSTVYVRPQNNLGTIIYDYAYVAGVVENSTLTTQHIYERANRIFAEVGETEVLNATNRTLREFCFRTEILRRSGILAKQTGVTTYSLTTFSSVFNILKNVSFIDGAGNYVVTGEAPIYKSSGTNITFYTADGAAMDDMPDYTVVIDYIAIPNTLALGDTLPTPDEMNRYIEAGVLRELFSLLPVKMASRSGELYTAIDWNSVSQFSSIFEIGIREGIRYKNINRNNGTKNIIQYDY